jgi:putative hydrolase of the HAD superfamily
MLRDVRAIFFDIGGTLGVRQPDPDLASAALPRMLELLGMEQSPQVFGEELTTRYKAYVRWRHESLIEVCEEELWTRWLLPGLPSEMVRPIAHELTQLWRNRGGKQVLRKDAPTVIRELGRRGYRLGIISNTINSRETPERLKEYGLTDCFSTVLLSCTFGRRKPDPAIFQEAARQAGVEPKECAYIGDRPSRDVAGPRRAGYAMTIILTDAPYVEVATDPFLQSDTVIRDLCELFEFFPPLAPHKDNTA